VTEPSTVNDDPTPAATREPVWHRLQSHAIVLIATLLLIGALYVAKPAVAPVLLAVLFALLLSPLVDRLQRWHLPRVVGAGCVMVALLAIVGGIVDATWQPAGDWAAHAPETMQVIARKVRPLERWFARVDVLSRHTLSAAESGRAAAPASATGPAVSPARTVLINSPRVILAVFSVIVLTFFFLVAAPNLFARVDRGARPGAGTRHAVQLINEVRAELARYLGTIALINVALGIATAALVYWLRFPTPILWGTVAAVLNFIPYIGPAVTLCILTSVALVTFDGAGQAVTVAVTFVCLAILEGQIVQPLLVGRRLKLNPLVIILAVWAGSWLWGILGVVLAVPCLVAAKATAEHLRERLSLVDILGSDPPGAGSEEAGAEKKIGRRFGRLRFKN
jgi:predicted PurR-regulated permease PerM